MNEHRQVSTVWAADLLGLFARSLRRLWWLCLVLIVLCTALFGGYARLSYRAQYTASITFLVNAGGTAQSGTSTATAAQMAKTFPYILTSGLLDSAVCADTGLTALPAISATSEEDTNLCTLSVTGTDAQQCYDVLQSVIVHYPDVAELVVGPTELVMMDQTGVPTQPSNPFSWRQPLIRGAVIAVSVRPCACDGHEPRRSAAGHERALSRCAASGARQKAQPHDLGGALGGDGAQQRLL